MHSDCHLFGMCAYVFRCANIVGARQTHGVGYDFLRQLLRGKTTLCILGNGRQSKSYLHVDDLIAAIFLVVQCAQCHYTVYNVATNDQLTVAAISKMIAELLAVQVTYQFTNSARGWPGDVPIVQLDTAKIRALGWHCTKNSAQAVEEAAKGMLAHMRTGVMTC